MSTYEDAFERSLCVERVIHIASWVARECEIDDEDDLIEELVENKVPGQPAPPKGLEEEWEDSGAAAVAEWLADCLFGNIAASGQGPVAVQYATPVQRRFSEDGFMWTQSWGHYATQWFWGDSLEDCAEAARQWREAKIDAWRAAEAAKAKP